MVIFQTIMNDIFQDLIVKEIIIVYLDNILIFTWTLKEYYKVVCKVLEVLVKYKLFFCLEKCKFDKSYIKYLDLVISKDQVKIDSVKVARVCNWLILTTYINLQTFLCFTNFY